MSLSLKEIMIRWGSFMLERAILKLNKVIDMLEKEIKIRRYSK